MIRKAQLNEVALSSPVLLRAVRLCSQTSPNLPRWRVSFYLLISLPLPPSTPPPYHRHHPPHLSSPYLLPTGYQSESITSTIPAVIVSEFAGTSSNWETVSLLHRTLAGCVCARACVRACVVELMECTHNSSPTGITWNLAHAHTRHKHSLKTSL